MTELDLGEDVGDRCWLEDHVPEMCLDIQDSTFQCETDTDPHPASRSYLFTLVLLEAKQTPASLQLPRNSPVCCHNPTLALDQDILAVLDCSWLFFSILNQMLSFKLFSRVFLEKVDLLK